MSTIPEDSNQQIVSKSPTVSKEWVIDSEGEMYECYCITADSGVIVELSLEDVHFIRNGLDKLIEAEGGDK